MDDSNQQNLTFLKPVKNQEKFLAGFYFAPIYDFLINSNN